MSEEDSACNYVSLQDHGKRIKELEKKVGNTNVSATLDSDAERITDLETRIDLVLDLIDRIDTREGK